MSRAQPLYAAYSEKAEDARTECGATDEKGIILMDGDNYRFSKEGIRTLTAALRKLNSEEVEIEPYWATEVPEDLAGDVADIFEGFVLRTEEVVSA